MASPLNVVVIGKTGVGKSTLINYLFGQRVRDTGVGSPVTSKDETGTEKIDSIPNYMQILSNFRLDNLGENLGFHPVLVDIDGEAIQIFDSWGLESGKDQEWMRYLKRQLSRRDITQPFSDWFHSAFYCIGAGGGRVEDFEIKVIKQIMDSSCPVTVLLTKADMASEDAKRELRHVIHESLGYGVRVLEVCSEGKQLRRGSTEPYGKDRIHDAVLDNFRQSLIKRLPQHAEFHIISLIESWVKEQKQFVERFIRADNKSMVHEHVKEQAKKFSQDFHEQANSEFTNLLEQARGTYEQLARTLADSKSVSFQLSVAFPQYDTMDDILATAFTVLTGGISSLFAGNIYKKQLFEIIDNFASGAKTSTRKMRPAMEKSISDWIHGIGVETEHVQSMTIKPW